VTRLRTTALAVLVLVALAACGADDPGPQASGTHGSAATTRSAPSSTVPSGTSPSPSAPADTPAASRTSSVPEASTTPAQTAGERWRPEQGTSWQYQLSGALDPSVDAAVFDVDWEETTADQVAALHAAGRRVICYVNAGAFEEWRPDAGAYPEVVLGEPLDGWPGERWLDVRRTDVLLPLLAARMDVCQSKGFDAVEADNVDGWANESGFPLTSADQIAFNTAVAQLAHARGMSIALKNDVEQIDALGPVFDFAVNEECLAYDECGEYEAFLATGKAVLHVEYENITSQQCGAVSRIRMSTILKSPDLGSRLQHC
jgi:hypothetical protein